MQRSNFEFEPTTGIWSLQISHQKSSDDHQVKAGPKIPYCGSNNVINHPFMNGLYQLSVIWGIL